MSKPEPPKPGLLLALIPVACLILFLFTGIFLLEASPHIPLILAAIVVAIFGLQIGKTWKELLDSIVHGISISMPAILILLAIGILIGTWVASGIVPLFIFYGLKMLSPGIFLVATCLICAVVSFATGSSWSTAGTVGVALVGIGQGLGLPLAMVAGAIVSGAYFGDKLSPLSDTTNLAPAVAGSELFDHIKHMLFTTVPSLIIALILYAFLGLKISNSASSVESVVTLSESIESLFNLSPILILAPLVVLVLIFIRIPALPALLAGGMAGAILGVLIQDITVSEMVGIMQEGYVSETGLAEVDELLSRGGLDSMMWTISLILCAMAYGGLMEGTGMLRTISETLLKLASTTGRLVATTIATCLGMNILVPDQYLSIIVPGRMYKGAFAESGLEAKNLSRCLEDAGTLTSPLIPWNTCGVAMMGLLLVNPFAYLPYAFLNLLNPVISLIFGFTDWTITRVEKEK
ncbi:MAG: Na+/H+ antiporter NhaC [Opitutaceae bacterium]|nr:Na+/H+ antiporter NhaC [Opitutaceae bacterium]|tara:strand:+ start:73 stop:1464 length:1392 start_codon:yes stop_codon:yes gene_type:complete